MFSDKPKYEHASRIIASRERLGLVNNPQSPYSFREMETDFRVEMRLP